MRNPSTRTKDDDLSRLTTSSASLRNETNVLYPADDSEDSSTDLESSYLPQVINSSEWQKHPRKRKERQDSTSSFIQDRKLIRSNSEEYLSISGCEIIRRVCSNEEIKCDKDNANDISNQYTSNKTNKNQYNDDVCSLKSTNNEVQEILRETHRRTETSPARSRTFDFSYKLRISPNREAFTYGKADGEGGPDCEPENRRSEERSCRARASQIPRKSLPNKKSPSLSRQLSMHVDITDSKKEQQRFDRTYKYDVNAMKSECRGFTSKESKQEDRRSAFRLSPTDNSFSSTDSGENDSEDTRIERATGIAAQATPPWDNSIQDIDQPLISQRFADNKFDHVNNSRDIIMKVRNTSETVSMSLAHFSKEETTKVRDVMKTTHLSGAFATVDDKMRQLNKRLSSLKKRITSFENKFERENGYSPSLTVKLNDSHIKNILNEIHKLRKEKQALKTDPLALFSYKADQSSGNKMLQMKKTIEEIEKRLQAKRVEENRSSTIDDLTADQLVQEKTALQRALLYLESLYGRPNTRDERDIARGLYDRYRIIKRLVNRNAAASGAGMSNLSDLPTILEHEAMAFPIATVSLTPPPSDCDVDTAAAFALNPLTVCIIESPSETPSNLSSTDSTDTSSSINENVHEMSVEELSRSLSVVRDEKRRLGRTIKEFEEVFEEQNGRKMLKSDRGAIEDTYALYKQKKAKLRLLDALIKKHLTN